MWLLIERLTILPLVVMGTKPLVVGGVDFPNFLAVGPIFGYCLHSTAIFVEDGVSRIGTSLMGAMDSVAIGSSTGSSGLLAEGRLP